MTNHIHLILKPSTEEGLQKVLKPLHMRYSQYINKKKNWSGHLWQGRYFSSALDEQYTYYAFRYVENNPVRAKMVENAADYKYSSARHHCGLVNDQMISDYDFGISKNNYKDYLIESSGQKNIGVLRRNINKNLPCGNDSFVAKLSKHVGKDLAFKSIGRPKKRVASPLFSLFFILYCFFQVLEEFTLYFFDFVREPAVWQSCNNGCRYE